MAASIWAMKLNDTLAAWFAGDAAGLAAAKTYVGANGQISMYPGTEGLTIGTLAAGVSLTRVGTGMEAQFGIAAFAGKPWHDVRAYGAKGDGTTNDETAIAAAITAAQADGSYLVVFPSGTYKCTNGGLSCDRRTLLLGLGEVTITLTSTTATLVKWASATLVGGNGGGASGIRFQGAGGSSTSTGISFGDPSNPSYWANRLALINCDVTGFGHGVVIDGTGAVVTGEGSAGDGFVIQRCKIYLNIYNGMFVKINFPHEINNIEDTYFLSNGTAQATGAGIQLSASGGGGGTLASAAMNLTMKGCTLNGNGNGTLAQIHVPASAWIDLKMYGCSFESITTGRIHIAALSAASATYNGPVSRVQLINCYLQNFNLTSYREQIVLVNGELHLAGNKLLGEAPADFTVTNCSNTSGQPTFTTSGNFITAGVIVGMPVTGTGVPANSHVKSVDSATQITINVNGTGATNVTLSFDALLALIGVGGGIGFSSALLSGNRFAFLGSNATNRRVLNLARAATSAPSFASHGNTLDNFATAASLLINPNGHLGMGDLLVPFPFDYGVSRSVVAARLGIVLPADPKLIVEFDISRVGAYDQLLNAFTDGGASGFMSPVVATASLPAGSSTNNGKVIIESGGAGDVNLIIYAQGGRYRIDGGTAF